MSLITKDFTFTVGAVIVASQHNANFDTIYSDYNGNITDANIASGAAISDAKLAQITTAGKVSGAAFTSINSTPSGAGALPTKNGGTGQDFSASAQGTVPYLSAAGVFSVLAVGTSGQILKTNGAAADPTWVNALASVLDYGTSASASTARQATAIKTAFGSISVSGNGTETISNLAFTASSSFFAVASFAENFTNDDGYAGAIPASASTLTIVNQQASTRVINWFAIGI